MKLRAIAIAFVCALAVGQARAAILFELDDPIQSGSPDSVLRFTGTVTNTGPESLKLAGFGLSFSPYFPKEFDLLSSTLMTGFRAGPGESFTGEILAARVTADAVGLSRRTTVYLFSWPDTAGPEDAELVMLSNPQTITMSSEQNEPEPTPEPATVGLMAAGFGLLALMRRRK